MSSCEEVDQALQAGERTSAARIVLDIEGLKFIDSSGLQVILRAKRRSDAGGSRLRITRSSGHVADMFRLTALDMTLPFAEDADG
jgi:anti-anti-sigma factor